MIHSFDKSSVIAPSGAEYDLGFEHPPIALWSNYSPKGNVTAQPTKV